MCLKGVQCSRSRQVNTEKCKIHNKPKKDPAPDGMVRKTSWREQVNGIWYFLCTEQKVYSPEDVMKNTVNPEIIGAWTRLNGAYNVTLG
jgi:hypothetical protein